MRAGAGGPLLKMLAPRVGRILTISSSMKPMVLAIFLFLMVNFVVLFQMTKPQNDRYNVGVKDHLDAFNNIPMDSSDYLSDSFGYSSQDDSMADDKYLSGCMLIKDDNDILNEWLAYHYFTVKLRYLIVVVDPSSETSPLPIFDQWRNLTDMNIVIWVDHDFMPEEFLKNGYYISMDEIDGDPKNSKWHEGHEDPEQVKKDLMKIYNHRYRQISFYTTCLKHMRDTKRGWVIHIDTDEYVVVNPLLRKNMDRFQGQHKGRKNIADLSTPDIAKPGSIFEFFTKGVVPIKALRSKINYPCVSLPRLLFGSAETEARRAETELLVQASKDFNMTLFESLRWKYHTLFNDTKRNAQPKVIVDVSRVPFKDEMFGEKAFSIHRPSKRLCRGLDRMNLTQFQRYPLSVNHYIGSFERYFARNDSRRSQRTYDAKAHVKKGRDDDWISPWLDGFVKYVGQDTAKELLRDYLKREQILGISGNYTKLGDSVK